jgi:hypothetical protein
VQDHTAGETILGLRSWGHGELDHGEWIRRLWELRRSARARFLLDELIMYSSEQALQRAITTIAQSDPLIKLLEQVKLGRMQPSDAGLRAITVSWLGTYQKVIESDGLSRQGLRRIDPMPRLTVLIDAGVLPNDHQAVTSLRASFDTAFKQAAE